MNEVTDCLECEKRIAPDTCWWFGKMTTGQQVMKIIRGCKKFRPTK